MKKNAHKRIYPWVALGNSKGPFGRDSLVAKEKERRGKEEKMKESGRG